jgi:hypothetical protein
LHNLPQLIDRYLLYVMNIFLRPKVPNIKVAFNNRPAAYNLLNSLRKAFELIPSRFSMLSLGRRVHLAHFCYLQLLQSLITCNPLHGPEQRNTMVEVRRSVKQ